MEPFGPDNLRPVFICKGVRDTGSSRIIKDQHIKFSVRQGDMVFSGIGFNMAEKFNLLQLKEVDIVFRIDVNEWNGERALQLRIIDLQ